MASHLHLVNGSDRPGGRRFSNDALARSVGRPGERTEPIRFRRTEELKRLASTAPGTGLPVELAISLLVQRQLVLDDLQALHRHHAVTALDRATAESGPSIALCGAAASYIRDLQRRRSLEPVQLPERLLIPLPFRIVDRLRAADRYRGLSPAWLEQARAWELASAIQGRTMAEWSMRALASSLASAG